MQRYTQKLDGTKCMKLESICIRNCSGMAYRYLDM